MRILITADIDTKNKFYLTWCFVKAFFNIKKITSIEIKPSVKKGYHMIVFTNYPYTIKQQFRLRKFINDDPFRLSMDRLRKVGRNTLFYKKVNDK